MYVNFFYIGKEKKKGRKNLRLVIDNKLLSGTEIYLFGLFSGLCLIFLFWIILLFSLEILGTDNKDN